LNQQDGLYKKYATLCCCKNAAACKGFQQILWWYVKPEAVDNGMLEAPPHLKGKY